MRARVLASIVAGTLLALPATGPAAASTPTVIFTGTPLLHLGLLSCPSTPDTTQITLAGGSVVNFANDTGKPATLLAGAQTRDLANGATAQVTFADGDYTAQMVPACSADLGTHQTVAINVKPAEATAAAPPTGNPPTATAPAPQATAAAPRKRPTAAVLAAQPARHSQPQSGATTNPTAQAPTGQPQTLGASASPWRDRDLILLVLIVLVAASLIVIGQLALLYVRPPAWLRHGGGGNGGHVRPERKEPGENTIEISAKAFEMGRRIGRREGAGSSEPKIMSRT